MMRILKITTLVSVVVLLNAITTLLFVQKAIPVAAGPQCVSGDINGDAIVDITDPIHLLSFIFEGGPQPVACAQVPAGITAIELDGVLRNYMMSPRDYAYRKTVVAASDLEQIMFDTGTASFFMTGFSVSGGCPGQYFSVLAGENEWLVKINGDESWGDLMRAQIAYGGIGFMLEPGTQITVENITLGCVGAGGPQYPPLSYPDYTFQLHGYWQN